jgi:8-oxo-dGTP pyrophosphatase MutT (NUDIX family)
MSDGGRPAGRDADDDPTARERSSAAPTANGKVVPYRDGLIALVHHLLLRLYQRQPVAVRRWIVRTIAPSYTVGAMCFIERADGALLLVRTSYRHRWGVPGGLLKRGEDAAAAARREVLEEVNLRVELVGEPSVAIDPVPQRVDVIYRARPAQLADLEVVRPSSPEIVEARWFRRDELPELQFETANALVTLARSAAAPPVVALPTADWSVRDN